MRPSFAALSLLPLMLLSSTGQAATPKPDPNLEAYKKFLGSSVKIEAKPGMYDLDKSHANIIFMVSHLGFSQYIGRFDSISGELKFDPNDPKNSIVHISIDPASVDTNNRDLEAKIKDEGLFNVVKFPTIRFSSTMVNRTLRDLGTVDGDISWMGVIKPIRMEVKFNGVGKHPFTGKQTLGFSATGVLKRSDFGLTQWSPDVGDEVRIIAELEFTKR